MKEKVSTVRLCEDKTRLFSLLETIAATEDNLYVGRMEHLLAAFDPKGETVFFYTLEDKKGRSAILSMAGNLGVLVTQKRFDLKFLAQVLEVYTKQGDVIITSAKKKRRLFRHLTPLFWARASGDNFRLPACLLQKRTAPINPSYTAKFGAGFSGFETKKKEDFLAEQNHLLRHGCGALFGIFANGRLISGCALETGSKRLRYLYDLTTAEEMRNKGLAAAVLMQVAKSDPRPLYLSSQDAALSVYYERLGLEKEGKWLQICRTREKTT